MKSKIKKIWKRIWQINFQPYSEWEIINSEPNSKSLLLGEFIFPITITIALTTFAGNIFAMSTNNYTFLYVLIKTISVFCTSFFTFYVSTLLVYEINLKLGFLKDYRKIFILFTYSFSVFWTALIISGILADYKTLGSFLKFLGLIGIYPFWVGLDILLNIPIEKKNKFFILSLTIVVIVYFLIDWSFGLILRAVYFAGLLT